MKRFFLIVSLAVCLSLMFAHSAFAIYAVEYETKTVSQGQTGVQVYLKVFSDLRYGQTTIPTVVRTVSGGAFWTGTLPYDTTQQGGVAVGVTWNWQTSDPSWPSFFQTVRPGVPTAPCDTEGDAGYDGTSPDHFQVTGQGVSDMEDAAPNGWEILYLTFDVNTNVGDFEFDSACFTASLNKIFLICEDYVDHGPPHASFDHFTKGIITIQANQCPSDPGTYPGVVAGTELDNLSNAWDGGSYTDLEGNAPRFYMKSGPGSVNETTGLWTWTPQCGDDGGYTVEIEVADEAHTGGGACDPGNPDNIIDFSVTVAAQPVDIVCPANQTVHWGGTINAMVTANPACSPTFNQTAGPGGTTAGGAYTFVTDCGDLGGPYTVDVTATDSDGRFESCSFEVTVTNSLPVCAIIDPDPFLYSNGLVHDLNPEVSDPDGDGLNFSNLQVVPTPPDNMPALAGGVVTWNPTADDAQFNGGIYQLSVDLDDGCEMVTCHWEVTILFAEAYKISILQPWPTDFDPIDMDHYLNTLNGKRVTMGVYMEKGFTQGTGAFDLLICYDQSVLSFIEGEKGDGIAGWEYFTYRYGPFGNNCGSGCPSGFIRLIGIRDMNNGVEAPAGSEFVDGFIAYLTFYASEDRSLLNLCAMIGFCSIDCGDNIISDIFGNEVAIAMPGQNGPDTLIIFGPDYSLEECMLQDLKGVMPSPYIYFDPGWICFRPPDDDRGDINLNGIANEVGDATLYSNYFIHGDGVLHDDPPPDYYENRVLASDINDDGIVLTVADLVYLIRIITGDAQPFPESGEGAKLNPYAAALEVSSEMVDGRMVVTTNSSSDLGAGHLVFRYTGLTMGTLETTTEMTVGSSAANGELNVLVYSMAGNSVEAGTNELVSIPTEGNGMIELVEASFSDAEGSLMTVNLHRIAPPTAFALMQNYPNPFNANTMIRFALPVASDWSMKIYNVAGQVVKSFEGSSEAGIVSVAWNADVASGIYFYKLTAGDFTATKKMVLMK